MASDVDILNHLVSGYFQNSLGLRQCNWLIFFFLELCKTIAVHLVVELPFDQKKELPFCLELFSVSMSAWKFCTRTCFCCMLNMTTKMEHKQKFFTKSVEHDVAVLLVKLGATRIDVLIRNERNTEGHVNTKGSLSAVKRPFSLVLWLRVFWSSEPKLDFVEAKSILEFYWVKLSLF